ncbi:NUDIX hydrolase [Paenibacillus aurantius]|uniref:NUDIX hydrolase n=1 Tax=Paenibacillus aurantius TaxID=2918900 RepID=A0AA96RI39_9BACL|nr:NUDIX hydrolase [Paenibacillus aurantius]WNQ14201.1 NUDIX hydrolase [Paenibacillus aurantius]
MEIKYCLSCGTGLAERDFDGTVRMACPACSFVHWGHYSVGVGALLKRDGKILLVRRAQEPGKGRWTNPGGYIEQHEPIHETIVREVLEETGVRAAVRSIIALRDQPRAVHNVYIAFEMEDLGGEPVPDGIEVDAAGFYSVEEIADMNVAGFTLWLIEAMEKARHEGLAVDVRDDASLQGNILFRA